MKKSKKEIKNNKFWNKWLSVRKIWKITKFKTKKMSQEEKEFKLFMTFSSTGFSIYLLK